MRSSFQKFKSKDQVEGFQELLDCKMREGERPLLGHQVLPGVARLVLEFSFKQNPRTGSRDIEGQSQSSVEKAEADQLARFSSLSRGVGVFFFLERGVDFEAFVGITRERTGRIAGRQFSGRRAAGKTKRDLLRTSQFVLMPCRL